MMLIFFIRTNDNPTRIKQGTKKHRVEREPEKVGNPTRWTIFPVIPQGIFLGEYAETGILVQGTDTTINE